MRIVYLQNLSTMTYKCMKVTPGIVPLASGKYKKSMVRWENGLFWIGSGWRRPAGFWVEVLLA